MSKKLAFTLSEVLITMSLVGVVAALTIPSIHYSKTKKEYAAKIKNFYSRMNNAILDMEMDKGSFKNMYKPSNQSKSYEWYINNIDPYYGHQFVKEEGRFNSPEVFFKDGSSLYFPDDEEDCMTINYDINALKPPNKPGYDIHSFLFCFSNTTRGVSFGNEEIFFGPYNKGVLTLETDRDNIKDYCSLTPSYCSKLLQYDQWEFKDDYPHKF